MAQNPPWVGLALAELNRPYRFGASGPAFDCSGLVHKVLSAAGVDAPRSAREQFRLGEPVPFEELQPGDLVFFRTYRRGASHVGIYLGNGQFVHAATRVGRVMVSSLDEPYYAGRYLGARRIRRDS